MLENVCSMPTSNNLIPQSFTGKEKQQIETREEILAKLFVGCLLLTIPAATLYAGIQLENESAARGRFLKESSLNMTSCLANCKTPNECTIVYLKEDLENPSIAKVAENKLRECFNCPVICIKSHTDNLLKIFP